MFASDESLGGILEILRRFGHSVVGLLHTRAELFAVEWQEEKLRAIRLLVWVALAIALGVAGVLVAVGALALFSWETAGYPGLVALAAVCLGLVAILLWRLKRAILCGPLPFAETLSQFRKDAECLRQPE